MYAQEQYLRLVQPPKSPTTFTSTSTTTSSQKPSVAAAVTHTLPDSQDGGEEDGDDAFKVSLLSDSGGGQQDLDLQVLVMTHTEARENLNYMHDCRPAYVVLYDLDVSLIRSIETYQSMLPASTAPVKVYCIMYGK